MSTEHGQKKALHGSILQIDVHKVPQWAGDKVARPHTVRAIRRVPTPADSIVKSPEPQARKAKRLEDDHRQRPKLPLKFNGEEVRVAAALAQLRTIRFVAYNKERLESLMELAHGRPENATEAVLKSAKTFDLLADDGKSLKDEYRAVLLSAIQNTPEGPVLLTNPFILKTEADRLLVEREQRKCDRIYRKIRNLPDDYEIDEQDFRSP
jgi:hypothetical protein